MFWGLIIESNKKYTQLIETSFHISMASLDVSKSNDFVQVNVSYENTSYLLCTLNKQLGVLQQALDLNFEAGTTVSFSCNGGGRVHLTGFIVREEDEDDMFEAVNGESDDDIPKLVPIDKKRKAKGGKNDQTKKLKLDESLNSESDSDDDDFEMSSNVELGSDDEDDDDDDDEEQEDDEDDEDDEDEEEDEAEAEEEVKVAKKPAKNEVVANGKDAKPGKDKKKKNKEKKDNSKTEEKPEQQQQKQLMQQQLQKKKVVEGGVQIEELKVGNGAPAKSGKFVGVYYVGRLKNGKKFDSTLNGDGFKFRLGKGEVIKGWDVGIVGMKVGGKRRITIPPGMAYGAKGSPPVIPPNSQLTFEVELKSVN